MKVLVAGTYCAGKTTLVEALHKSFSTSLIAAEPAGEIALLVPNLDWSMNAVREYLIVRQILIEKKLETGDQLIFCDGGVESNIAHDKVLLDKNSSHVLSLLGHKRYDLVFFCDHQEVQLRPNGLRMTDQKLREVIAREIYDTLIRLEYTPIILKGARVQRLSTAISVISQYKASH